MNTLTVCAPLGFEARALRRGLADAGDASDAADASDAVGQRGTGSQVRVVRTGHGPSRAAAAAARLSTAAPSALAVSGVAGALSDDLRVGDVVVATEVSYHGTTVPCPSAPLLAGELGRAGLRVSTGPVATVDHLVRSRHASVSAAGAIAVDMESGPLLGAAAGKPVAVLRAISDTPGRPVVSTGIVTGGLAALRSLRQAAPVLARWAAALGPRRVLLASPRSFCAGVERAIEIVELALEQRGAPVYVRKQIVHNATVVADLERRGAIFVDELTEVPAGANVVFSAHGVAPDVRQEAARRGLDAIDATCPLVAKVHAEARRYAADGYLIALIGHAGHEEVEGTLGEAPGSMALVERPADVARLAPADPAKVAYLMQTTLATDEAGAMVDAITERFPAATGPGSDDICYATTNRQAAVRTIAARCDVLLVAGSANSSNSVRLVETAERAGAAAYLVDRAEDIELRWLAGAATVGITAGASAPPAIVDRIVAAIGGLGETAVEEVAVTTESVQFGLPKELRRQTVGPAEP